MLKDQKHALLAPALTLVPAMITQLYLLCLTLAATPSAPSAELDLAGLVLGSCESV